MVNRPEPKFRDLVYNGEWQQPNGFVVRVFYNRDEEQREVLCKSWDNGETSVIDADEFKYCWVETNTGGYWALTNPPTPEEIYKQFYKKLPRINIRKYKGSFKPRVVGNKGP